MTRISSRTTIDHADTAAEAVSALIHLTHGQRALEEPAELDRLVAELAIMAGRLPQLIRQLRDWLHVEQHAGRLRSDNNTDPAQIVDRANDKLAQAGHAAHDLGSALDNAHQLLAHLATEPDRTHKPGQSDASAGTAPRDGRAETMATSGHFHGHQRAGLMAASGQKPMSLDTAPPSGGCVDDNTSNEEGPRVWIIGVQTMVPVDSRSKVLTAAIAESFG